MTCDNCAKTQDLMGGGGGYISKEPSTTSTRTRIIGQEGHDGDSDWDRLSAKYCGFIVDHIERNCGGWGDLGLVAFDDAVVRIRKKGGLFIKDYRKGMFRKALIRLSRDTLSVLGKRRDRQKLHDRLAAEGLLLQGGPSRSPGLSDEEIALRGLRFRICRELLSGDYRNTDLADKFTPEEEVNAGGGGDGDRIGGEWVGCPFRAPKMAGQNLRLMKIRRSQLLGLVL